MEQLTQEVLVLEERVEQYFTKFFDVRPYERDNLFFGRAYTPLLGCVLYLIALPILSYWRRGKERVDTKLFAQVHNIGLSVLSLYMSAGCFISYMKSDVHGVFCVEPGDSLPDHLRHYYHIYYLSKYYEYIDTILLILNNKPLSLLHVYHHCLVTLVSWTWARGDLPYCSIGVIINSFIHVVMYYYFYKAARGDRVWWKEHITHMQIAQFILGVTLPFAVIYVNNSLPNGCASYPIFWLGTFFNGTLLYLFVDFFIKTYLRTTRKPEPKKTEKKKEAPVTDPHPSKAAIHRRNLVDKLKTDRN